METSITSSHKRLCVVLDTNVWRSSLLLRTPIGAALLYAVRQSGGCIGLPEVIEEETVKQIIKAGLEAAEGINKHFRTIEIIMAGRSEYSLPAAHELDAATRSRFEELNHMITRVPFTLSHAKSALEKIILDLPPNSPKNQQFKDSAIWEAVIELSSNHNIYFITSDSGFYQDRDIRKGLSVSLIEEVNNIGGSVRIFNELPLCLPMLQESIPPLNHEQLATGVDNVIHNILESVIARRYFSLKNMISFVINPFLTERLDILAIEFKLGYDLEDISRDEESRNNPFVIASGSCFFDISNGVVFDIRQGSEEFTWYDAQEVKHQNKNIYGYAESFVGRRTIAYTFRAPL